MRMLDLGIGHLRILKTFTFETRPRVKHILRNKRYLQEHETLSGIEAFVSSPVLKQRFQALRKLLLLQVWAISESRLHSVAGNSKIA